MSVHCGLGAAGNERWPETVLQTVLCGVRTEVALIVSHSLTGTAYLPFLSKAKKRTLSQLLGTQRMLGLSESSG